jgi:precorrin-4/cobalt-precorrin-4 C11-methyltransferase
VNKVYFIGAGPGDPELITVKGKNLIEDADVIIYAGSLVNKEILNYNKKNAEVHNSATLNLEEIIKIIKESVEKNLKVVRVHTGDPSIFSAVREQADELEKLGIDFEIIPGVSSFTASAAVLKKEFTLPDVTQTVIITRIEGRTKVPVRERLDKLAKHNSSMAVFLSAGMIDEVVNQLLKGYKQSTPASVVYKATWENQKIINSTLGGIAPLVKEADITETAMILVGDFLKSDYEKSKLYDSAFSHKFRKS